MNIAIDARWIFRDISGIGNYTRQLLRVYAETPGRHHFKVLFSDQEIADRTSKEAGFRQAPHMQVVMVPWGVFSLQSQIHLPRLLKKLDIQVFHSPNYMIPFAPFSRKGNGSIRAVTTIHDLIPLKFPDHAPQSRKSRFLPLFRAVLREAALRSSRIATVSHVSAVDIAQLLRVPANKIDAIHNGVSRDFCPTPMPTGAFKTRREQIELLYVGRADPYKNINRLIHVVDELKTQHHCKARLTLVGAPDPRYPETQQKIDSLGLQDAVRWTGFVNDAQLLEHLHASDVMLHASRYEGFGLQIIEAMACGIPVVCSNAGSLPEVAGGAAILVEPDDTGAFCRAVLQLRDNEKERERRIEAGIANAKRFSWEKTARATLDCYEKAAPEDYR
jgi:glycosyltransferase involved in cell wall biosynthesis